ncbi:MAG: methionyl-tRNA formyltransferase [Flavobacteriales bacterium]|nr:methionyl-tRNA formyltransferase [Flavobacteriales bacterium]
MKYNTELSPLIIPEYGRHIHSMANSLLEIKDSNKRNKQALVLINIMGNLNPHLRDTEEYKHKLWDHLFIMCQNKLEIDAPYPKPKLEKTANQTNRIDNTQGSVKYKHYGKLIIELIKEAVKVSDEKLKKYLLNHIAQQMKRSYLNWNQSNVQDSQIWTDLEYFANEELDLDKTKVIPVYQTHPTTRKKTFYKKSHKKNYSRK